MFKHQVNVRLVTADLPDPVPARAGEDEIDEKLELIRPQAMDHCERKLDRLCPVMSRTFKERLAALAKFHAPEAQHVAMGLAQYTIMAHGSGWA